MVYESLSAIGTGVGVLARIIGFSHFAVLSELNPALLGFLILFSAAIIAAAVFLVRKPMRTRDPSRLEERVRFYQDLYSVHRTYRLR